MPIRLVDGAMKILDWIPDREALMSKIEEIERFYEFKIGKLKDLDGVQSPEDYDSQYYTRYGNYEWTQWHDDHAKVLKQRTRCESMIDVGCGYANIVLGFLHNGVDAYGLEYSIHAVEHASQNPELNGRVFWGDIKDEATLPNRKFQLSIGYDLFEHVPKPEAVVTNFCNLSSKWLHVKVPDIRGLNQEESRRFDASHVTGRSLKWWISQFESHGFQLVMDAGFTLLKFDPEYAFAGAGAPDLHALFKRKLNYK